MTSEDVTLPLGILDTACQHYPHHHLTMNLRFGTRAHCFMHVQAREQYSLGAIRPAISTVLLHRKLVVPRASPDLSPFHLIVRLTGPTRPDKTAASLRSPECF